MGVIVQFSYAGWQSTFPEFGNISSGAATGFFNRAVMIHRNDGGGPIDNPTTQLNLLNLVVAHLAWLNSPRDANGLPSSTGTEPAPALVGRITSAGQGSVNVSVDAGQPQISSEAWWQQSRFGAEYWTSSEPFRIARYMRGRTRRFGPRPGGSPYPY